jgi:cytochrome b subunit of formate dehydrogenase/nitrate/TMAO reductase-like tetraheme cytochrome c subunit
MPLFSCRRALVLFVFAQYPALSLARPDGGDDGSAACTTGGCHEEGVDHDNAKHADVTCIDCHPNIPDGQAEHGDALDDTPTEVMCATAGCHPDETRKLLGGYHKDAPCEGCHGDAHGEFKAFDKGTCRQCHKDELSAFNDSAHGKAKKTVTCSNCHGDMHGIRKTDDPLSPMSKVLQVTTCSECHDSKYVRAYRQSVHGQGVLKSGLAVAPACADCHGSHEIAMIKEDSSRVSRKNVINTCGKCHEFILSRWKNSTHGALWLKGDKKGPVCVSCHSGHETFDPTIYGNHLKMADKCGECHEEQASTYRDSFHGKATRLGFTVAATCADCHTPHEMLPQKDPNSSVNAAHLESTCNRCHPNANAGFIGFRPHLDPTKRDAKDPAIHLVWLFMSFLMVTVLGFFTLHTLLWLQRSVVALVRREIKHPKTGDVWIRRFIPLHRAIHIVIVLTFLTLAATGLPLKLSNSGWGASIAGLFGGLGGSRILHRIAGVLTFVYAFAFLSYLVREVGFRKRTGLLFGWQSMTPNLEDLKGLWANLKWFLYQGPLPKLDRWAYWEKFDFLAIFWGVPAIGLSGLVLWEPNWFTAWLPGWIVNVAYLIHSDEALMATGFIFFFHFFHTHLRPESFPMDTVIFTGSMPLERLKEERPSEYERLVRTGELEKYKTAPPSERTMRRVHRFGFFALSVGVLLGAFLVGAGLKSVIRHEPASKSAVRPPGP